MLLGQTELNIKETVHNGGHDTEDWGGIPVVAIFGDDYQLPPPVYPGAFVSFEQKQQILPRQCSSLQVKEISAVGSLFHQQLEGSCQLVEQNFSIR